MYDFDLDGINYGEALDVDNSLIIDDIDAESYGCGAIATAALGVGLITYAVSDPDANPDYTGWGAGMVTLAVGATTMTYLKGKQ